MAKKKLKLTLSDGTSVKVKILATYGCLALHTSVTDDERVTITHVPSGCAVMSISNKLAHKDIAPFLRRLSEALTDVKPGASISSEAGRKALPWIDLIKAASRVYETLAARRTYIPIAINRPKARRTYPRPAQPAQQPVPQMLSIQAAA